jgi:hypothetical protein
MTLIGPGPGVLCSQPVPHTNQLKPTPHLPPPHHGLPSNMTKVRYMYNIHSIRPSQSQDESLHYFMPGNPEEASGFFLDEDST